MSTPGTEITAYDGGQLDAYRPQIMTPEAARALDEQVRMCTRAVLREGTDYGTIPGTGEDRKVLLKPGAEKLLQWFGFGFRCDRTEIDLDDEGRRQGVTYRCVITKRIGHPERGLLVEVTTCEGYAGYDEPKFYKSAEQAQRDAEARERHWAKIDRRVANPTKWKNIGEYRAPWNTVIKMAQKRAIVGAAITATAAAGLFTDEDSSADAPPDGGPSWYQRALGEASAVTSEDDARRLWAETVQVKLTGAITADQATHIQNRLRKRVEQLASHVQVDVEDLARAAAAASQTADDPAETAPNPPGQRSAGEAAAGGERPPALAASGHASQIDGHRERLGYTDSEADRQTWLFNVARLAGLAGLADTGDLTQAQATRVIRRLKTLPDGPAGAQELMDLLDSGVKPEASDA